MFEWNLDPNIFFITSSFPLKWYGLLFAFGIVISYQIFKGLIKKSELKDLNVDNLLLYVVIGTIAGARLGHFLFYDPSAFIESPLEIILPFREIDGQYSFTGYQGLASHGGTIGIFISLIIFCKKYNIKLIHLLDYFSIVVPICGGFIRLANFANSEIIGKATNGTWGVIFAHVDKIPRHPTQLYEALSYFFIFIILSIFNGNKQYRNGKLFGLSISLIFLCRFIIEFFKEPQMNFENQLILNMGQLLSLPIIFIGFVILLFPRLLNTTGRKSYI